LGGFYYKKAYLIFFFNKKINLITRIVLQDVWEAILFVSVATIATGIWLEYFPVVVDVSVTIKTMFIRKYVSMNVGLLPILGKNFAKRHVLAHVSISS